MKVLVIGGGGREHSICHAISKSNMISDLYCAPGNAGIEQIATSVSANTIEELLDFSKATKIDFVIVGPEVPLVDGIVNRFEQEGIKIFGPSQEAAILEGSKSFMKDLCRKNNIPTASSLMFTMSEPAAAYIRRSATFPIVIKADGLAAGKGVFIVNSVAEGVAAIKELEKYGTRLIIEEYLDGEEVSFFVLTDGKTILPLTSAQDHKKVSDGDEGLNTGGMGAYSPAPVFTKKLEAEVMETIIVPTVEGMKKEGREYKGVLYAGLILTEDGPKLLEYNIRFGDPECQVLMQRLESDLLELLLACVEERLDSVKVKWYNKKVALTVVMASEGYPEDYETGTEIRELEAAEKVKDVTIFHAGTRSEDGKIVSAGGRVLNVTATGSTVRAAQRKAYKAIDLIDWAEGHYRTDIGWRAIKE